MYFLAAECEVLHDVVRRLDSELSLMASPSSSSAAQLLWSSASLTTHDRFAAKLTSRLVLSSMPLVDGDIVSLHEPSLPWLSDCLLACETLVQTSTSTTVKHYILAAS